MTQIITADKFSKFKSYLEESGYSFEDRPHQYFLARKKGLVVNLYINGKIVFSGKNEAEKAEVQKYLYSIQAKEFNKKIKEYAPIEVSGIRIGTDEVGKGDYFGPLIIGGVVADESQIQELQRFGIKDSKSLSDTTIQNYSVKIKQILKKDQYSIITIGPLKYNLLHKKMGNVNRILGWGHARAIENLLKNNPKCSTAIADQFGDQSYIESALMKHGKKIELKQTPKAEREITVAAASVLARSEFINRMAEMNESYGIQFPKGATDVISAANNFVELYGSKALVNVAKVHFKTTQKLNNISIADLAAETEIKTDNAMSIDTVEAKISRDILLECYNLISSFEQNFRKFISNKLKTFYGENWWKKTVDISIRNKVEALQAKERQHDRKVALIDCLEMDHYRQIVTDRDNWQHVFQQVFKDKEMFLARLKILRSVRNQVAHSRGTFSHSEKLDVISSIQYFNKMMN